MLCSTPAVKFTYEDYQHTPDDQRYELLDGELIMALAPNLGHQRISTQLGWRLAQFVAERGLGEVFFAPCDEAFKREPLIRLEGGWADLKELESVDVSPAHSLSKHKKTGPFFRWGRLIQETRMLLVEGFEITIGGLMNQINSVMLSLKQS